jgi:hypothetical protein
MTSSLFRRLPILLLSIVVLMPLAFAKSNEITQFGHDIRVATGQQASELTCLGCSIYIAGQVAGEVTTIGGNIIVEENGMVGGDVTTVVGDLRVADGTKIGGDVAVVGGTLRRQPGAMIGGDVTEMRGRGWIYLVLLSPFLIFAGIIALIVWLVQRRRRPATAMARAA